jgi:hypothetical protein
MQARKKQRRILVPPEVVQVNRSYVLFYRRFLKRQTVDNRPGRAIYYGSYFKQRSLSYKPNSKYMQAKVKRLLELRSQIQEVADKAFSGSTLLKSERDAIQQELTEELKKMGQFSARFEGATVTRSETTSKQRDTWRRVCMPGYGFRPSSGRVHPVPWR